MRTHRKGTDLVPLWNRRDQDSRAIGLRCGGWVIAVVLGAVGLYRWSIELVTRFALCRLKRGNARWILALMTDDVHFRFLGEHSWSADFHSKSEVKAWLDRYVEVGLQLEPLDVVVSGPPWKTVVCIQFVDSATDGFGNVIYSNEGVLVDRVSWGRIREHISYEDTQRTAAFDARLPEA
jgi:hypothetical protein